MTLATRSAGTCAAGLSWCVECYIDEDGRFHNSAEHVAVMDRDGNYRPAASAVEVDGTAVDRFDGTRDLIVFIAPAGVGLAFTLPREMAFTPAAARAFAAEVVRVADEIEGGHR